MDVALAQTKKRNKQMARIIETSPGRWQVAIDFKGVRKKETIRGTKALAQKWARDQEQHIQQTGKLRVVAVGSIGELVEGYERDMAEHGIHWSHTKSYNLLKIKEQIGHKALRAFDKTACYEYGKMLAKTRGPNGVKERLGYLSKAMKWGYNNKDYPIKEQVEAVAKGLAMLTGYKLAGDGKARTRNPSDAEIDAVKAKLMRNSGIDMAAIIDALRVLPFRVGELCSIEWGNLSKPGAVPSVKLWRKPGFWQVVALPVIGGIDTYKLIAGRDRHLVRPFPYAAKTVSSYFSLAARYSGVEDIHLHDLRAHAVTWLRINGVEKDVAKALMGHSSKSTVLEDVYTRVSPAQVHEEMERSGVDVKVRPKTGQVVQLRTA
jgi:integrase